MRRAGAQAVPETEGDEETPRLQTPAGARGRRGSSSASVTPARQGPIAHGAAPPRRTAYSSDGARRLVERSTPGRTRRPRTTWRHRDLQTRARARGRRGSSSASVSPARPVGGALTMRPPSRRHGHGLQVGRGWGRGAGREARRGDRRRRRSRRHRGAWARVLRIPAMEPRQVHDLRLRVVAGPARLRVHAQRLIPEPTLEARARHQRRPAQAPLHLRHARPRPHHAHSPVTGGRARRRAARQTSPRACDW